MATHSITLAWRIPQTEETGRLQSMGLQSRTRLSESYMGFLGGSDHKESVCNAGDLGSTSWSERSHGEYSYTHICTHIFLCSI